MAVKASATISIYRIKEVTSTTNYYLIQSSTAAAPSKPTTDSPGGKWTTSEPAYTDGSTLTLYTVIKTKYSDNTFEYTPVSKSTSYEAAKSAYNKAQAAQNSATSANNKIDNLEIGGRNFLRKTNEPQRPYFDTVGLIIEEKFNNCSVEKTNSIWDGIKFNFKFQIEDRGFVKAGDTFTYSIWGRLSDNETLTTIKAAITAEGKLNGNNNRFINTRGGLGDNSITKEWKRFWYTFTVPAERLSENDGGIYSLRFEQDKASSTDCYIMWACPKLEKGNKPTDWTPSPEDSDNVISQDTAPEDTSAVWFNTHDNLFYKYNGEDWIAVSDYNEDISKLKEDVGKIDSTIDGKINSYNDKIKNTYYTKAQVDSQIETNERGIKEYYSGTLQTIREDTTGLSNRITAIEGYIQKGLDDNGQPFVELGTQASPYKLKITNDAIQITYLGEPVSNWKQDLIELNTVITSYLNLGKFSFVINSDDSLSFRKIR